MKEFPTKNNWVDLLELPVLSFEIYHFLMQVLIFLKRRISHEVKHLKQTS